MNQAEQLGNAAGLDSSSGAIEDPLTRAKENGNVTAQPEAPQVTVEFDLPARMRDGVTLRANVYRPAGPGPWPTLLARTPYGKGDPRELLLAGLDPVEAARRGFMVVIQDTRGRHASEGQWDPFVNEGRDGYDSVEWAARLPGSSGKVGMFGGSYLGNTQWLAAAEGSPSLAAISPLITWADPSEGFFTRGGAVELGFLVLWLLETGMDYLGRTHPDDPGRIEAAIDEWDRLPEEGYWGLPIREIPALKRHGMPGIDCLDAANHPDLIAAARISDRYESVAVPSLNAGGWNDVFLKGTIDNYLAMKALGREARLVIGPWAHLTFADPIGDYAFGVRGARDGVPAHPEGDWADLQLAWFTRHLLAGSGADPSEPPVRIFVMGRNTWRNESAWPLERASVERWYLRSGGQLVSTKPSTDERTSSFVYDPADPVPTVGGQSLLWPGMPAGPSDQAAIEGRDDVLVFTSEPLEEDLEVTGPVRMILQSESSAPSTDWVARLCDVHPDGRSFNVCDGIVRVQEGAEEPRRHEIDLWSTSNVFLRGHRLRVHVTSSSFPRWDRNLNTGNQHQARHTPASQRVHHHAEHPSFIELPVVR